jgi:voltage-gated potassium channel Kch
LRNRQIPFVFGDADHELVLAKTHLETAKALAIALPDPTSARLLLQRALAQVPDLDIIARSHTNKEIDLLTQLGAKEVVQPEFEAALELGSHLLRTLGEHPYRFIRYWRAFVTIAIAVFARLEKNRSSLTCTHRCAGLKAIATRSYFVYSMQKGRLLSLYAGKERY